MSSPFDVFVFSSLPKINLFLHFIKSTLVKPPNKNLSLIFSFSYSFIYKFQLFKIFQFFTTKFALFHKKLTVIPLCFMSVHTVFQKYANETGG